MVKPTEEETRAWKRWQQAKADRDRLLEVWKNETSKFKEKFEEAERRVKVAESVFRAVNRGPGGKPF